MELTDFYQNKPWLIEFDRLEGMCRALPEMGSADLRVKSSPEGDSIFSVTEDGIAILPIVGPLSKRLTFLAWLFGARAGMVQLAEEVTRLGDRGDIRGVVLDVDTPGGTVAGTEMFGNAVYAVREKKPVVAFANGMMCSGGYWVGSGAHKIIGEETSPVGSIGVVMTHVDYTGLDAKYGVKVTVMRAGKYKALGGPDEPLSDLAKKTLQAELDYYYSLFVNTVSRNRGVSAEQVLSDMADGRVFIGRQALDAGLIDAIGSLDAAVDMAREMAAGKRTISGEVKTTMDLKELQEKHPDLFQQVMGMGRAEVEAESSDLKAENADLKTKNQELEAEVASLKGKNVELEAENKDMSKRVMTLEAKDVERDKKEARSGLEKELDAALSASAIPEKFYARVKRGIDINAFIDGEGKVQEVGGKTFQETISAEIADWEKDLPKESAVLGGGSSIRGDDESGDDDALADELVSMADDSGAGE